MVCSFVSHITTDHTAGHLFAPSISFPLFHLDAAVVINPIPIRSCKCIYIVDDGGGGDGDGDDGVANCRAL